MASWHTELEKRLIEERGGTHQRKTGTDGTLFGRPVEVRAARKDDRFRLGKDVHRKLVRERGNYIFHDEGRGAKVVPATEVSEIMGRGKWFEDRDYPHRFVETDEVFSGGFDFDFDIL